MNLGLRQQEPYTLHPTPYTLETLHPTPYTLHPPFSLHPEFQTLNPKPGVCQLRRKPQPTPAPLLRVHGRGKSGRPLAHLWPISGCSRSGKTEIMNEIITEIITEIMTEIMTEPPPGPK